MSEYPTPEEIAASYRRAQAAEQARRDAERERVRRLFDAINASLRRLCA